MRRLLSIIGVTLGIIAGATQTIHPPAEPAAGVHAPTLGVHGSPAAGR